MTAYTYIKVIICARPTQNDFGKRPGRLKERMRYLCTIVKQYIAEQRGLLIMYQYSRYLDVVLQISWNKKPGTSFVINLHLAFLKYSFIVKSSRDVYHAYTSQILQRFTT